MRSFDFRRYAPVLLIAVLVITPLAIWAATSGGSGDDRRRRSTWSARSDSPARPSCWSRSTIPTVEVTNGRDTVEVECTDATGKAIVKSTQPWPFPLEAGYPPHAHVAGVVATRSSRPGAARCIGTNKKLAADVQ